MRIFQELLYARAVALVGKNLNFGFLSLIIDILIDDILLNQWEK